MNEYILGDKKIKTTAERYEATFKALGYVSVKAEKVKEPKNKEEKQ
jgi:hypothetical protein